MSNPIGYVPGFHAPGTTVPIGYIMEQQRMIKEGQDARQRRRRTAFLLLMQSGPSGAPTQTHAGGDSS